MSASHNPSREGNAPQDGAPPAQSHHASQPPSYAPESSAQSRPAPERQAPPPPGTKPEASAYIGSYRPSDAQQSTTSVCPSTAKHTAVANVFKASLRVRIPTSVSAHQMTTTSLRLTFRHQLILKSLANSQVTTASWTPMRQLQRMVVSTFASTRRAEPSHSSSSPRSSASSHKPRRILPLPLHMFPSSWAALLVKTLPRRSTSSYKSSGHAAMCSRSSRWARF
jgi:hypothetical protein